jgi:predicted DNA binding CopG/RHH family protein
MPGTKKQLPKFRSEDDERRFWAKNDSTGFIDWQSGQKRKFPELKPSLRTISLRLPVSMIEDLKILANKRDVPYQSLLKVFLAERLEKERRGHHVSEDGPPGRRLRADGPPHI